MGAPVIEAAYGRIDDRSPIVRGGSRNFHRFIDGFDAVFVLEVDLETLMERLARRPEEEWGGRASERELVARLHATKEDLPVEAIIIDATVSIESVVDAILESRSRR